MSSNDPIIVPFLLPPLPGSPPLFHLQFCTVSLRFGCDLGLHFKLFPTLTFVCDRVASFCVAVIIFPWCHLILPLGVTHLCCSCPWTLPLVPALICGPFHRPLSLLPCPIHPQSISLSMSISFLSPPIPTWSSVHPSSTISSA
jgi:hypothetical protein